MISVNTYKIKSQQTLSETNQSEPEWYPHDEPCETSKSSVCVLFTNEAFICSL